MDTTTQPQQEPVQITVADLASILSVLDLAAQRGAFRGVDLTAIGLLYDKLAGFVKYAQEQTQYANASQLEDPVQTPNEDNT
jgi:hypothetical protein